MPHSTKQKYLYVLVEAIPAPAVVTDGQYLIVANSLAEALISRLSANASEAVEGGRAGIRTGEMSSFDLQSLNFPAHDISHQIRLGADCLLTVFRPRGQYATGISDVVEGAVIVSAFTGTVVYLNETARALLLADGDSISSCPDIRELLVLSDSPETSVLDHILNGGQPVSGLQGLLRSDSLAELRDVRVNAAPLKDNVGAVFSVQDISDQKHADFQMRMHKQVLELIASGSGLEQATAPVVEYVQQLHPGSVGAIYQLEHRSRHFELVSAPQVPRALLGALSDDGSDPISRLCVRALITGRPAQPSDLDETASDVIGFKAVLQGSGLADVWCYPFEREDQHRSAVLCLYRTVPGSPDQRVSETMKDIKMLLHLVLDRVQIEDELRLQSFNDSLTGLPNRVLLIDRLEIAVKRAEQSDQTVALLLVNIDRFQMVNSSLGHHAGDELLRQIARRLRDSIRSDDLVARFDGDSFALLLDHITSETDAINVVMRVQRAFAIPFTLNDVEIYVSTSIGIAMAARDASDATTLVRHADIALERAREAGQGQFAVFSPARDLSRIPKIELQARLPRALAADELELYFQPIMLTHKREVAGYEALIRWTDTNFGLVSPDEFLPLAQQAGIMSEITAWVLDRAARQLRVWDEIHRGKVFTSINISPREMNDSVLVEQVDAVLNRYRIEPSRIMLEMTEHALLDTFGDPKEILKRLRNLGVRLALDDFGTGYSSLSYLEQLSVDAIKIDRSFIQAARGAASRAPVATAMVDLARKLSMISVAEGIETDEDERVARQLGCDYAQGYLYGRPQPGTRYVRGHWSIDPS
jgi:diguanylate cyclase (GGDEF)-like protein